MPDMIRDGQGRGYLAGVDSENRFLGYSTMESEISHESEINKSAFSVYAHAKPGTSDLPLLTIRNDNSTKNMIIEKIVFSSTDTTATNITKLSVQRNPTGITGGVAIKPVNLNFNSNNTADATCLEDNDGVNPITIATDGPSILSVRIIGGGTQVIDFQGALVLGVNAVLSIKGQTDDAAATIRVIAYFYYHNPG